MSAHVGLSVVVGLLSLFGTVSSVYYIPGAAARSYEEGEIIDIWAVKLMSITAQLPYDYFSLPFCRPANVTYRRGNLGEVLSGDRIVNTKYWINMNADKNCVPACNWMTLSDVETDMLRQRILQDYSALLLADDLPCVTKYKAPGHVRPILEQGHRLGYVGTNKEVYINNHLKMIFSYKMKEAKIAEGQVQRFQVVGFEIIGRSINWGTKELNFAGNCDVHDKTKTLEPLAIPAKGPLQVLYTFEVEWRPSNTSWSSRWDVYLELTDAQMHVFSTVNSLVIVVFLSGIMMMVIVRTLRKDIAKYNEIDEEDEEIEESGWKLVYGDVFRAPQQSMILVAFTGSGIQILGAAFLIIVFAMCGLLSPAHPGSLTTAIILLYEFMGALALKVVMCFGKRLFSGYFSGRLYRTLNGDDWQRAALLTGMLYHMVVFGTCFILNIFFMGYSSSSARPVGVVFILLFLWFGISLPLVLIGFFFGFRKQPYVHPVRVNQIPRQVPEQKWYMNPLVATPLAGMLPFGAMYVELYFIFNAIWENQFYYIFGFLFVLFVIVIVSCSEIAIVMTYFQLCAEDYHWWWRSFLISGGSAIFVFLYGIFFFITKLEITEFVPTLWYFGYTILMTFTIWLMTGVTGFYACYFFVIKIYSSIKVE